MDKLEAAECKMVYWLPLALTAFYCLGSNLVNKLQDQNQSTEQLSFMWWQTHPV